MAQMNSFRQPVELLPRLGVARQLSVNAAGGASNNVALTTTGLRGVRLTARNTPIRFTVTKATPVPTATATSHYLPQDASIELAVESAYAVAGISDLAVAGTLEITELL